MDPGGEEDDFGDFGGFEVIRVIFLDTFYCKFKRITHSYLYSQI